MLAVGAIQLLILVVGLVRAKFLSVALGPAGYGLVSTIDQIIVALVSLGTLGLPFVGLKFMARAHSEGRQAFERTYAGFLWPIATLGLLTAAVGFGVTVFAPQVFGADLARYRWIIGLAILGVPAAMVNILIANGLAAAQKGSFSAVFTFAIQLVLFAATVVGVIVGGPTGLYVASVSAGVLATVFALGLLRGTLGSPFASHPGWFRAEIRRDKKVLSYSAWVYVSSAIYAVSMSSLRTSVFAHLGAVNAGLLQAALGLALSVGAVITPMSNLILTPHLNRSIPSVEKVTAANDFAVRALMLIFLVGLPLVLFPRFAVSLLFAREFLPAAQILFMFILWQSLAQLVNVYTQLLIGLDDVGFACGTVAVSYGSVFLLAPVAVPFLGLPGAVAALIFGAVTGGIANLIRLRVRFGMHMTARVATHLGLSAGSLLVAALLTRSSSETSAAGLGLRGGIAAGLLATQWLLLDKHERRWLEMWLTRFRKA